MAKRALALDLGSSSVRAIVFEASGAGAATVVPVGGAMARRPRSLHMAQAGQATFDVDDYLGDLVACIDELHAKGHLEGVTDVATDSQWHSIVGLDAAGRPEGEMVSWADTRPRRPEGGPTFGPAELEELRQRTGCAFAPMYWTWRAPWLAAGGGGHAVWGPLLPRPGPGTSRSARPARFVGLTERIGLELLDDPSMSVSMASGTGLLATAERAWDAEALELAGLGRAQALPPLAPPGWQGRLAGSWRRRWPELAGAVWHPAVGDGAAANLGVGCGGPGRVAMTVGTSAAVRAVTPLPGATRPGAPRLPPGLWRYCVDHDRVVLGAAYSSGGQLYAWALSLWEGSVDAGGAPVTTTAAHELNYDVSMPVGAGSEGVIVLPWHAGTRPPATPVPGGQGCVVGLGLGHSGAHVVSAAVESVCFQLAGGLAELEAGAGARPEVVVNGGAIARSQWWQQRLASTLGRPIKCSTVAESTARGAAALALGVELCDGGPEGTEDQIVEPVPADVGALASARRNWAEWYASLQPRVAAAGAGGQA